MTERVPDHASAYWEVELGQAGDPLVVLGLSGENVTRLVAGEPIALDLSELGLPSTTVAIVYGKTESDIHAQLKAVGLL